MVSHVIESILVKGDIFVDVGANIGYDSLLASKCVDNNGLVIAIEASPTIYNILSRNVERNSAQNIRLVNKAASDHKGELPVFAAEPDNIGRTTTIELRGFTRECSIEAAPIEELLSNHELAHIKLIKIDIEGGELPVLRHFIDTISLYPTFTSIIVEASVQDDPEQWTSVFQAFLKLGFSAYTIENRYDVGWYIRYRKHSFIKRILSLPNKQVDILLTRLRLPSELTGEERG